MDLTHRCLPCGTFASVAGLCTFCGEWMSVIDSYAFDSYAAVPAVTAPCPDWPEDEPDQRERVVVPKAAPKRRTRKVMAR